jgi:protoporphyrinogen/coproporphyrinogen III oxidase
LFVSSTDRRQIVVVGGGISGLSAAYYLLRTGLPTLIIEKQHRFGGLIRTDFLDGCELEAGPDSFIACKPAVAALATELGIAGEIIGSNDAARRIFIVKGGKLVSLPAGMVFMVPGDLEEALRSDFFGPATKDQFLRELSFSPRVRHGDVSIREFVVDHFGEESLEYLTEPLLSGVYGGDSAGLSARSVLPRFVEYERQFGSLIRGVREERAAQKKAQNTSLFLSFRGGMQTLTDALQRSVLERAATLHGEVDSVAKTCHGWRLHMSGDDQIEAENLVLAGPAHVNAHLLRTACPELAGQFAAVPYSSALLVTLVYDRKKLDHPLDGFGYLVPRPERQAVAAATWVSTKFPSRTPADRAALRAFIVGAEAAQWMACDDSELISLVRAEFHQRMGVSAVPLLSTIHRWPNSMPQYTVGHDARKAAIKDLISDQPGLHFCGNWYDGVGIPDCIRIASSLPDMM